METLKGEKAYETGRRASEAATCFLFRLLLRTAE